MRYFSSTIFILLSLLGFSSCVEVEEEDTIGNWIRRSDFEGVTRSGAVSFTIGNLAYAGLGFDGDDYLKDFWQYDPQLDFWQRVDDFPGQGRTGAVAFSIGDKGYMGTGYQGDEDIELGDFWEFDPNAPSGQQWTQKPDFAGTPRYNAVGFGVNGKGFIGTGYDGNYLKDFWQYDPAGNTWSQAISIGGTKRESATAFVIDGRAYVGTGRNNGVYIYDFWEFEPESQQWLRKTDLDEDEDYRIARHGASSFSLGGLGYIVGGSTGATQASAWEYDPLLDIWQEKTALEGASRLEAAAFVVQERAYVTTGQNGTFYFDDIWEFFPFQDFDEED